MPAGNPLGITDMVTQQKQKVTTNNEQLDEYQGATETNDTVQVSGNTTLTAEQFNRTYCQRVTAATALAANFTLYVPANERNFAVDNGTGFDCTVRVIGEAKVRR